MTRAELARLLDHSVLKPEATEQDIVAGAAIVREWQIGYYCVQPCWVATRRRGARRHRRARRQRRRAFRTAAIVPQARHGPPHSRSPTARARSTW